MSDPALSNQISPTLTGIPAYAAAAAGLSVVPVVPTGQPVARQVSNRPPPGPPPGMPPPGARSPARGSPVRAAHNAAPSAADLARNPPALPKALAKSNPSAT